MAHIPDSVIKLLEGGHTFWVATATRDGIPNIAIKGSGAAADKEHLYFADVFSKKTRRNLEDNPNVAIGIYDPDTYLAVQVKGQAAMSDSGALYEKVVDMLRQRAPSLQPPTYVVEITVESVWDMSAGPNAGERIA
jgi:hypothetical protein